MSDEELRELIKILDSYLCSIPQEKPDVRWFIAGALAYLRGEFDSLDEALGLR